MPAIARSMSIVRCEFRKSLKEVDHEAWTDKLGLARVAVGTAEGIRLTKEIGFDTIDIFADPLEIDIRERRLIKDTCREVKLPVVSTVLLRVGDRGFQLAGATLSRAARQGVSRSRLRTRGPEPAAGSRRVHLAARGDHAARPMELGRGARSRARRACRALVSKSPSNWNHSTSRWSTIFQR